MTAEELVADSTVCGSCLTVGDPDAGEAPVSTALIGWYGGFGTLCRCSSAWMRLPGVRQGKRKTSQEVVRPRYHFTPYRVAIGALYGITDAIGTRWPITITLR